MPLIRRSPAPWLPWLLGVVTLLALSSVAPQRPIILFIDPRISIIMVGVVAFVVNVEVPLQGNSISLGYAAGLLIYLSLGRTAGAYEALAVIALGSLMGGILRAWWITREGSRYGVRFTRLLFEWPLTACAQLTLSMMAGGAIHRLMGGRLPIDVVGLPDALALAALIAVSAAVYLVIYSLSVWWRGLAPRKVFERNRVAITLALAVPLPFIVTAALLPPLSLIAFFILGAGLLALAIGATALGGAQLRYQQQVVELQSLSAVNSAMRTHLDLGVLLEMIHLQVMTLLEVHAFTLALYDPSRNVLSFPLVTRRWQRLSLPPRELGMDVIDHVIATKAPLLLAQNPAMRAKAMDLVPPEGDLTSWLGVPLLAPDRPLGCIAVSLEDPYRTFTERDQRLLVAIATQSSVAIENALLYRQVQERARQLTRLNSLSMDLSGTLNSQHVLEVLAQATVKVAGSAGAAVFLWDGAHRTLSLTQSAGLSQQFIVDAPLPLSLIHQIAENSTQPLVVQNARLDPRVAGIFDLMRREQINAWIELPLARGDDALGFLIAYYRAPRTFTGDETELLKTFANQATLSISNARAYSQTDDALERRIEQLSALASINKELLSTLNLANIFKLVLDWAIEGTRSLNGVLLLSQEMSETPRRVAQRGDAKLSTTELLRQGVVNQAFTTGQSAIERNIVSVNGLVTQLAVPLVRDYDTLGVILLESQTLDAYSPDDVFFVTQLAILATVAIDNGRLFEWMHDSHNRLQVILDSMNEAVILFDLEGRIALANPRVASLLGFDPVLLGGEKLEVLTSRSDLAFAARLGFDSRDTLLALFEGVKQSVWQGNGRFSYRLDQPQTHFIDRTIVPVYDQNRKIMGLLMVFSDATEERQLAQTREDLTRMIVHDLRSPLTAINTSMKLLTEMIPPGDALGRSIQKTTDVSQRALRKLLNLVDSLLDIAKMESGTVTLDTEQHDLRPIAESVRIELSPLAEELNIAVDIDIPESFPLLAIDGNKIERVLLNLVDNALKFTPVDGQVQIRACGQSDNMVLIHVIDNGPGVPDDYKVRIFERFQQIDQGRSHRRGTGLGLTFCRLAVEAHGGKIWIEDNPAGGSIFAFTLPIAVG